MSCAARRPFPRRSKPAGAGTARVRCPGSLSVKPSFTHTGSDGEARHHVPGPARVATLDPTGLTRGIHAHPPCRAVFGGSLLQTGVLDSCLLNGPAVAAIRRFVNLKDRSPPLGPLENQ